MSRTAHLRIPFFDAQHRAFADEIDQWAHEAVREVEGGQGDHGDIDATCVRWVRALGAAGWLKHCVPAGYRGAHDPLRSLYLVVARETLARHSGLADFAFVMQGLGSGPIGLAGSDDLKKRYLPKVGAGAAIAAFALTEPEAGSDVAAVAMSACRVGDEYVLDGEKQARERSGKLGGRKSYAEARPETVALAKQLRTEGKSYRKISVELAARGHKTGSGRPYVASAVQAMLS